MSADIEYRNQSCYFDYVHSYLRRPIFLLNGSDLRVFSMLGDRTAVAIIKSLYPDRQVDLTVLKKITAAVCASLEYPTDIEHESDRVPAVTICLLEILMARAESAEEKEVLRPAVDTIQKYTCGQAGPTG